MTPATLIPASTARQLADLLESFRVDASRKISSRRKGELGQFFTPAPVARFMASLAQAKQPVVHILDAGAGVGTLFGHAVAALCSRRHRPDQILVTAYESDPDLASYLSETMKACQTACEQVGIKFVCELRQMDFLQGAADILVGDLFASAVRGTFNYAILNPPYFKINTASRERRLLREIGVETTNIYTGFLAASARLLAPGGELVAITPRSFCNGPYFRPFREMFFGTMQLRQLHLFDTRDAAFQDDEVLQENIIFHAVKTNRRPSTVMITSSAGPDDEVPTSRQARYDEVIKPDDPECVVHIATDTVATRVAEEIDTFTASLDELGVSVSTGRVVDFRSREFLRDKPSKKSVPLIYPNNFQAGIIEWPIENTRKPSAIERHRETESLLVPNECFVLVKRFSAKEERRRVVAAIVSPRQIDADAIGIENHLNYFHRDGRGLDERLARGLTAFLNSTLLDTYFRQFSGHTQVNATDLRRMRYPSADALRRIGKVPMSELADQASIDRLIDRELLQNGQAAKLSPINAMSKLDEAAAVLKALGLPKAQQNERSALTLLALLDLKPDTPWSEAAAPLRGITQMMDFFAEHYGKAYKPNTRESVRRQTVHQFVDAGLIIPNPDEPTRPINSGKTVYQMEPSALELVRTYGSADWDAGLRTYLTSIETLAKRYAQQRDMAQIPIVVSEGKTIVLSPGGQNVLVKLILEEFCPRYTPGGKILYVGDTGEKFAHIDTDALTALGISFDSHGKMPDVIVHYTERDWLILIEAVTSHGPVDPKRHAELKRMFQESSAGLVYVTAFPDRRIMAKYLNQISWETEVWTADAPDHLIHFNGERFLGPY